MSVVGTRLPLLPCSCNPNECDKRFCDWQAETPSNTPDDFVFASFKLDGKKPRTGNMIVADYLRLAIKVVNGATYDMAGNVLKRFEFNCFRHTLASFLLAQGNSPCANQEPSPMVENIDARYLRARDDRREAGYAGVDAGTNNAENSCGC